MVDEEVRLTYGKEGLVAADLGQYASLKNETAIFLKRLHLRDLP